jgi:YfiH family protein
MRSSAADLVWWDAPGPYRVAFTTRTGGVSDGPYRSLNLGLLTDDASDRVVENRRRACRAAGADAATAALPWQQHGAEVLEAQPTGILASVAAVPRCDGLWSSRPGQAVGVLTADCLPIVLCRAQGAPAVAALHVGWRGLLAGIVAAGVRALGGPGLAAAVGPGIGPCCYEVGEDVAAAFRAAFGPGVVSGGRLDLWASTAQALEAAGCTDVTRTDLCTACNPDRFFSHRRDRGRTGRQGVIAYVVH